MYKDDDTQGSTRYKGDLQVHENSKKGNSSPRALGEVALGKPPSMEM